MGDIKLPKHMFLWSMSVIYMFAFASLYVQIPGLYGNDGILPARRMLRYTGKPLLEQLQDSPTLLWLGPQLGLDTQQGMELICLLGTLMAFGAMVWEPLRDALIFLFLWVLYLSLYQVGQVFLYFQWDSLLLETGFLTVLVAPFNLFKWKSTVSKRHDGITFWLIRWLFFRLMFASGVVKLTSRCPAWWGLTALTYHYETQCIPTPVSWFAHQLPVWFQKLSVVGTYAIEIAVPFMFFAPIRSMRIVSFYLQAFLQVLIILTGNYNFFNLLTIVLSLSLLDDEHVYFFLGHRKQNKSQSWTQTLIKWGTALAELASYCLIVYWTAVYFELEINWEKKSISSKTAFTYHEFNQWLKTVTIPSIWIGVLSLTWEIITAMFKCASVRGFFWKLWATIQWAIFATAAACMFAVSLVPYTYIENNSNSKIWPGVRTMYDSVDRFQLVNSYGLFRRMTGVGGRPEVVVEGSYDKETWTEIEFMYKPGNVSAAPQVVAPHQPRLDWQMWFAALGPHAQSPWFTGLVQRLLQGKKDVIDLVQVDESQYPFKSHPPTFIRAHLYKYWFTKVNEDGSVPQKWWRRQFSEEFYPTVFLGDPSLVSLLNHFGLKDKGQPKRNADTFLPVTLRAVREYARPLPAPLILWSLFFTGAAICLLKVLFSGSRSSSSSKNKEKEAVAAVEKNDQAMKKEEKEKTKRTENSADSDKYAKKRK
ncbi:lipase maturation factor 2-like [Acipenser oxyrinchus oxyrinchus]|uniref:Lipase maturation factor n=1 Tax=Acipenser oxyrinchus oxyrinchus TaxID=40147 RepID=A0AAD8DDT9_ACIOX|nr:lipase maturation factor 2-like [Acipenser oxyrinchus oxyrinchus]